MSSLPTIQVPDMPVSAGRPTSSRPLTPKTSKSMLRNLFSWKKAVSPSDGNSLASPTLDLEARPTTSNSQRTIPDHASTLSRKPSLTHRSRSDTAVPQRSKTRSKSRKRSRSRARAVWDPPPIFQAYTQAFMHDTLHVPSKGFLDWLPRSTTSRSNAKNTDVIDEDGEEREASSRGHSRSTSSSSTIPNQRIFFLTEDGHILQYKVEGSQDRLPERVIELSYESVAFASDAVAGKHWVLEVCPYGRTEADSRQSMPRSPWSRMSLKTPESKRFAEKLLMVFDNPDTLFSWLIAIRKQIEGLGGMEYQPDIPSLPPSQPQQQPPTLRHATSEHFKRPSNAPPLSRSSSLLPLRSDDVPTQNKDLPQLPAAASYQRSASTRSIAASSIMTTTSLDRLRESYSGSSTTGTALSSDASLSPLKDTFPAMLSPVSVRDSHVRGRTEKSSSQILSSPQELSEEPTPTSESFAPQANEHDSVESSPLVEEPKSGAEQDPIDQTSTQREEIEKPSSTQDRRVSTISALPVTELRRRLRQAQRNLSAGQNELPLDTESQPPSGPQPSHGPKLSVSTGTYGLFPKRLALDVKAEPLVVPDKNAVPGLLRTQATDHLEISESPITPVAANFGKHLFARANSTLKRPVPIALPHLLAPIELEQPMRSPAVTDAMLATNFGTSPGGSAISPVTPIEINVPGFEAIRIDQSVFETFRERQMQRTSSPPKPQAITPRRSMPNFHYRSASLASVPNGPPPSYPLPAVPPIPVSDDGRLSRSSTRSKRASAQSPANRRASTKSTASMRHTRAVVSPAPTIPVPSQVSRASSNSGAKKSPPTSRAQSPSTATSSPEKPDEAATTIGQVSVVSAPPRFSSLAVHRKSPSESSVESNKPGKFHLRTPSGRLLQSNLNSLSSITHIITPTCGFGSDTDLLSRGCFGISASR